MSNTNDQTNKLERLEAFEERAGVKLAALFAQLNGNRGWTIKDKFYPSITVNLEVHSLEGNHLKNAVSIVADAYDSAGRLVYTTKELIGKDAFFGFQTVSLSVCGVPGEQISKIRVYPKLGY